MAKIPDSVLTPPIEGMTLLGRGKVRDNYAMMDFDKLGFLASDRCSIFDFVLNTLIPFKGQVLTAMNHFWTAEILSGLFETDYIAAGGAIDEFLLKENQENPLLQKSLTIVKRLPEPDVEDIVRFVLTGTGYKAYLKTGEVCGQRLPAGLVDGSQLPFPIYTPTTKAKEGHDEHVTADSVAERYGVQRERMALQAAAMIAGYAHKRGIMFADTKFELSCIGPGQFVIADEKATPDSSRFMDLAAWQKAVAAGKPLPSLDKQYVREWGKSIGVDKRDPKNPEDVAWVHQQVVPAHVVAMTTRLYRYIFWRLTGMMLETYQRDRMSIANVTSPRRRVEVVIGSQSDLAQTVNGLDILRQKTSFTASVVSCHRNPDVLRSPAFLERLSKADVIIAGAGSAAQLPGVLKAELCLQGHPEIPVIGVAFVGANESASKAARLSIEELPGKPVELDLDGRAYFGSSGFAEACSAAINDEFLPKAFEKKSAQIGIDGNS